MHERPSKPRHPSSMFLTDNVVKALAVAGLVIYAASVGLTLTGRLGHWPLTAALFAITISAIVVMYIDGLNWDRGHIIAMALCIVFAGAAVWQAAAASTWSMVAVMVAASLQSLFLIAILLFLYLFRMDRLW